MIGRRNIQRGFTLLELLVVMVLATLILSVVPASFTAMVPHVEQQAQVRDLIFALRSARGMAVREGQEVKFTLDLANHQYTLSGSGEFKQLPNNFSLKFIPQFDPVPDEEPVVIHFFADGSSSGGRIDIASDEVRYEISINWLTGKIDYHEKAPYES